MKLIQTLPLLLLAASSPVIGQLAPEADPATQRQEKIHYNLIFPEEKIPETVKPNENNPFVKSDGKRIDDDQTSSEENTVRDILTSMVVTGIRVAPDGTMSAMLGGMILQQGNIVPQVINRQTVRLKVNSISETSIDLVWVEQKKNTGQPPRVLPLTIDLKNPKVRYSLASSVAANKPAASTVNQASYLYQEDPTGAIPKSPIEARKGIPVDDATPTAETTPTPPPAQSQSLGGALLNLLNGRATPTAQPPTQIQPPPEK